jgi:spore coat polysaccharide biosynthesis protein SpsF
MSTIVIIQARMGSSRLPGKVMLPLGNTDVLDYVVSRSRRISGVSEVIVATSTLEQDDQIADWCHNRGVAYFRGPEDDVLARYVQCADQYQPDYVIRVTSDCPFVDYELGSLIVERMKGSPSDIVILEGGISRGLPIEMISYSALKYIEKHGLQPRHREHVTYYAYEYTEQFKAINVPVPESLRHPELRITLDTPEDYQMLAKVADAFNDDLFVSSQSVVQYLLEHPEVAAINAHIQQKPVI